jgi:hypothetical protein
MNFPNLAEPVPVIVVFLILYILDYYLTVYAARLYRAGADQVIVLGGSYELNPRFVSDIDRVRKISPRFIASLILYSLLIWGVWYLTVIWADVHKMYRFVAGGVILVQGPIQVRHMRNILAFRHARDKEGISGRIEYSRAISYAASALELVLFSGLYLALAFVAGRWELAGHWHACPWE